MPGEKKPARLQDRLRLVSHFPGRLRVRAETFRVLPEVANEVVEKLGAEPGVSEVKVSPITGSLVVSYDPRELQLPRLIQLLVRFGGLHGIEVDAQADWTKAPPHGDSVREAFGKLNESIRETTKGKLDLKVAVPGALVALGASALLRGRFVMPMWYDFFFWSFVTFQNLNPRREREAAANDEANDR